jgi:hypothetical protein
MTDLELLFLVFGIIYLWECARWLRPGTVVFQTWLGRRWRLSFPGSLLGNPKGGLVLAHPLPPLGVFLTGNQFPLSLSPNAILTFVAASPHPAGRPAQTATLIRWENLGQLEVRGSKILVDGQVFLKAASPTLAASLTEHLRHLSQCAPDERERALRKLSRGTLDARAAQRRWLEFQKQTVRVRWLANGLFCYLFLLTPALIWNLGLRFCWLPLLLGLVGFAGSTAWLFRTVFKRLYPAAVDERFTHSLTVLLSPATTIRAYDLLARPLLEGFHPLTLAKIFCADERFQEFARWILREIRHPALPLSPGQEPVAEATARYWRELCCNGIEQFLKANGVDPNALDASPKPLDDSCRAYCPHCLAQFTSEGGACADCGGLPLLKLRRGDARPFK